MDIMAFFPMTTSKFGYSLGCNINTGTVDGCVAPSRRNLCSGWNGRWFSVQFGWKILYNMNQFEGYGFLNLEMSDDGNTMTRKV